MVIGAIIGEKEQLKVWIRGSVIRMLKHEIALNRPTICKGMLSEEVENAINHHIIYLRRQRSNKQQTTLEQQNAKEFEVLLELKDNIIDYMVSQTDYWPDGPMDRIIEKHLFEAIASVKAVRDIRTKKGWAERLFKAGIINRTGRREFVFCNLAEQEEEPTPKEIPVVEQVREPSPAEIATAKEADDIINSFQQGQQDVRKDKQQGFKEQETENIVR